MLVIQSRILLVIQSRMLISVSIPTCTSMHTCNYVEKLQITWSEENDSNRNIYVLHLNTSYTCDLNRCVLQLWVFFVCLSFFKMGNSINEKSGKSLFCNLSEKCRCHPSVGDLSDQMQQLSLGSSVPLSP